MTSVKRDTLCEMDLVTDATRLPLARQVPDKLLAADVQNVRTL
jgi:hypothetical protein